MNINFQLSSLKKAIARDGKAFTFIRDEKNDFNELDGAQSQIVVNGIYHEVQNYVKEAGKEGATTRTEPQPMIMCIWEDAQELQKKDYLIINNIKHNVAEIKNVSMLNIVADVSLEVVS